MPQSTKVEGERVVLATPSTLCIIDTATDSILDVEDSIRIYNPGFETQIGIVMDTSMGQILALFIKNFELEK